ncbi:MAG: ATP-binding protein [Oscillospiraceae bacterium]|nr:ATP-binding protein [Oscillospiraceae bacterium]
MVKVIIGEKGTGKTAKLIDAVNAAEAACDGSIVFINKGDRHIFDLTHRIRIVDTDEYAVKNYDGFYGFICGILSQNYDIKHIFIDSITKIVNKDLDALSECLDRLNAISDKAGAEIVVIVSLNEADAPDSIKKYI